MKAVFADTFCWGARTNPADSRYHDALALDDTLAEMTIVTTAQPVAATKRGTELPIADCRLLIEERDGLRSW